ncbi:MAG: GIY-YIG nuclease family protein [Acidobacteriota bacterium]
MAFERCLPQVFSFDSIRRNAPAVSGVYGISNPRHWLYVGETDNIQASLFAHVTGGGIATEDLAPSGYRYEECSVDERRRRQQRLISELAPVCQQQMTPR